MPKEHSRIMLSDDYINAHDGEIIYFDRLQPSDAFEYSDVSKLGGRMRGREITAFKFDAAYDGQTNDEDAVYASIKWIVTGDGNHTLPVRRDTWTLHVKHDLKVRGMVIDNTNCNARGITLYW